jgi:endonuclease/exonuclease/phosphatase family metal-dependent hydrolase
VPLGEERALPPSLDHRALAQLTAVARRRALVASPLWARLGDDAERLTRALEYRRPTRPAPRPERRFLRCVSWNIERGNRMAGVLGLLQSAPELADCDFVILNEADVGMARSGNRHVAREIAEALGMEMVFGNSYLCLSPGDARDGAPTDKNSESLHGNAILSRWPLRRAENFSVAISRDKFESSEKRLGHKKALWAEAETPLGPVAVLTPHLDPYASARFRGLQMEHALAKVREHGLGAVILGGDFNTSTYDLESLPALIKNVLVKMWRGGFAHAIAQYMKPQEIYERPIFEALERAGFEWKSFNDMAAGSVRYEVGTFDSESKLRDHVPGAAVHLVRWKLAPYGGVVPLKIDWFAGRGVRALGHDELVEPSGRSSRAPAVLERARWQGEPVSDHDPIVVDFVPG